MMTASGPAQILVVDDEVDVGQLIVQVLERSGFRAQAAINGVDALDRLADERFDLMITDLRMPQMNGMELVGRARELYPDVSSMVLTAYATLESAIQVLKMGAEDYIVKPFDVVDLTNKVEHCLADRELRLAARHAPPEPLVRLQRDIARAPDTESAFRDIFGLIERWFVVDDMVLTLTAPWAQQESSLDMLDDLAGLPGRVVFLSPETLDAMSAALFVSDEPWLVHDLAPQRLDMPRRHAVTILLETAGDRLGMLRLTRRPEGGAYTVFEAQSLYILGAQLAATLRQAHTHRELLAAFDSLTDMDTSAARALVDALGTYDGCTREHSRRVSDYARVLAARVGLDPDEVQRVAIGGLLHDIGKLGVSGRTLRKSGRLTDSERQHVLQHPIQGAQILAGMESLSDVVPLVRHHHERYDGTGYPDGLSREQIPLGARILAVVDAYDSMTSDRPYRATLSTREARRRLKRGAGTQWDANLVQLWFECMAENESGDDDLASAEG